MALVRGFEGSTICRATDGASSSGIGPRVILAPRSSPSTIDTSALVDALTGPRRSLDALERLFAEGHRLAISSIVLYEWLRGPRTRTELAVQEDLFPPESAAMFGSDEAALAARLYKTVPRARGREIDLAIAACALTSNAQLWTLHPADFRDVPGLRVLERTSPR
jgi:predicted nucleic acid-binding protein